MEISAINEQKTPTDMEPGSNQHKNKNNNISLVSNGTANVFTFNFFLSPSGLYVPMVKKIIIIMYQPIR